MPQANAPASSSPSGASVGESLFSALGQGMARNWWAVLLRGLLAVAFGLLAFFMPGATMLSLVFVFAGYTLADGVLAFLAVWPAARAGLPWGLLVLEGVVDIIVALAAASWPGLTVAVFVLMVAAWAVVSGALMLGAAFRLHAQHGRWWLVFGGLVSVLYGFALFVAPLIGALVLTWWIGAYALFFGLALIMLAFRLRSLKT